MQSDGIVEAMPESGWTADLLKVYCDERFKCADDAIGIVAQQAKEWRAAANEWRGALSDANSHFLTKEAYVREHENLASQISDVRGRVTVILLVMPVMVAVILGVFSLMHLFRP